MNFGSINGISITVVASGSSVDLSILVWVIEVGADPFSSGPPNSSLIFSLGGGKKVTMCRPTSRAMAWSKKKHKCI